ncbi:hypothetical protein BDN72DRAFT_392857 [Pluteus cervinus]|uniref:Uncharacterized protein n=1 Tax=Pluteus cervinus TaxID=181527 RepID=A0ACD3A9J8_9AGAR|nr:hypothetical protein BDN72DRAFT_392857 [Pluteus cervinus]
MIPSACLRDMGGFSWTVVEGDVWVCILYPTAGRFNLRLLGETSVSFRRLLIPLGSGFGGPPVASAGKGREDGKLKVFMVDVDHSLYAAACRWPVIIRNFPRGSSSWYALRDVPSRPILDLRPAKLAFLFLWRSTMDVAQVPEYISHDRERSRRRKSRRRVTGSLCVSSGVSKRPRCVKA